MWKQIQRRKQNQNREQLLGNLAKDLFAANSRLVILQRERGKRSDELIVANQELVFQQGEKGRRSDELIIAKKELIFQQSEKGKRSEELILANKELVFQQSEKGKRSVELRVANKELAFQRHLVSENEENAKLYRMLLDSQAVAHIGSFETDLTAATFDHNTWIASPEVYNIFGIETSYPNTLAGWFELIHPDSRAELMAYHKQVVDDGQMFSHKYRIIRVDDGQERWVHETGMTEYRGAVPIRMFGTIQDITERKVMEQAATKLQGQLQQSQKMESLGVLAGGVAHDMNNVLGAILGLASAFVEIQPPGTPAHGAFETILKAASRGGVLVKSLLAFARQTLPNEQELDLNAILQDEVRILAHSTLAKVRLELDLAPDLRHILGDASALTHAFMNLCVNAVDAMPDNGTLTLRSQNVDNDWAEVVVADNGHGMAAAVLAKAMDPFFTTKGVGKGTGLGLPMVYTTVRAHHGQLDIQSEPGRGTRVRMRFPACITMGPLHAAASAGAAESREAEAPPPPSTENALTVLVVDDDEMIRDSMQTILDHLGHTIILARSGEEALAKLKARFAPDIIILDMNMPGLGGFKTLPLLRSLLPTVPIILATGRVDQTAIDLAKNYPNVTLLAKPFTLGELKDDLKLAIAHGPA